MSNREDYTFLQGKHALDKFYDYPSSTNLQREMSVYLLKWEAEEERILDELHNSMVTIPAGSFEMGSTESTDEQPIHQVTIKAFKLAKYEVTEMQWYAVMGYLPEKYPGLWCGFCPLSVADITWKDLSAFINKLNERLGRAYRLPSEAEWEYACRSGGKDEKYCGGDDVDKLVLTRTTAGRRSISATKNLTAWVYTI